MAALARLLPQRAAWVRVLRWLPFTAGVAGLAWLAADSRLGLDLFSLLTVGGVALFGLAAARRWSPLIVCGALLLPHAWHFAVTLPGVERDVEALPLSTVMRVDATIRDRTALDAGESRAVRLLLGGATLRAGERRWALGELELELPTRSAWPFRSGRGIRVVGRLRRVSEAGHRLRLAVSPARHAFDDAPAWAWGEAWRTRLADRGAYYLTKRASAVYVPMVLDIRDRSAVESRDVVAAFRRVGVSHIFAISGMNVALVFAMLMVVLRPLLAGVQRGQGWVGAPDLARGVAVGLIWLYIAVIGLPLPAVRAAIMGTALVWLESRGARTPPLYVLAVTGLAMLAWSPGQLYDVSFQLSFLAYAFLILALEVGGTGPRREGVSPVAARLRRWAWLGAMNLGVTGVVTLGLWPVIAARFGSFSWLVFAGNLLLVPAMGAVILPSAMAALAVSALYVGSAPGGWVERGLFAWLEACLDAWLWLLRAVDHAGGALYFRLPAAWSAAQGALYYAALLALLVLLIRLRHATPRGPKRSPVRQGGIRNAIKP